MKVLVMFYDFKNMFLTYEAHLTVGVTENSICVREGCLKYFRFVRKHFFGIKTTKTSPKNAETYSEFCQASKMEPFVKIVNEKSSILENSEYVLWLKIGDRN